MLGVWSSLAGAVQKVTLRSRYSYLVIPGVMTVLLAGLAAGLVWLDSTGGESGVVDVFRAGPDGSRAVLSVIAGSLITVLGVTFSVTIVTLQLVSQQFSPRALRHFLGDRLNQLVAGTFVSVFVYCLVVLTAVDSGPTPFVPGLAVVVAFLLTLFAVGMLLLFIDHLAHAIQVSRMLDRIAESVAHPGEEAYPEMLGRPLTGDPERLLRSWRELAEPVPVRPSRAGFVQAVIGLPEATGPGPAQVALRVVPGAFVTNADVVAEVWAEGPDREAVAAAVAGAIVVASERDVRQDTDYGLRQLTDIAVKALSPSLNDPTTATTAVGYVRDVLERLVDAPRPAGVRYVDECKLTLLVATRSPAEEVASLVEIARYADHPEVLDVLLDAALSVARRATGSGRDDWALAACAAGRRILARARGLSGLDAEDVRLLERRGVELDALAPEAPASVGGRTAP